MKVKRVDITTCGEAPRCGEVKEDRTGEYVRSADLINALQNPDIVWTGGEKMRVATVNGHRIGFVEKYEHFAYETKYRCDSRYAASSIPLADTQKKGEEYVEKAFRSWLAGVIKVV